MAVSSASCRKTGASAGSACGTMPPSALPSHDGAVVSSGLPLSKRLKSAVLTRSDSPPDNGSDDGTSRIFISVPAVARAKGDATVDAVEKIASPDDESNVVGVVATDAGVLGVVSNPRPSLAAFAIRVASAVYGAAAGVALPVLAKS